MNYFKIKEGIIEQYIFKLISFLYNMNDVITLYTKLETIYFQLINCQHFEFIALITLMFKIIEKNIILIN